MTRRCPSVVVLRFSLLDSIASGRPNGSANIASSQRVVIKEKREGGREPNGKIERVSEQHNGKRVVSVYERETG